MKTIHQHITILLLVFASPIWGQTALEEYLIIGAENNPGLKARFAEYHAALKKVEEVGVLPDPSVSFGYFVSPIETRVGPQKAKISLGQMFPWFGTLAAKEDVAIERAHGRFERFEQYKSELFFNIKSAYFDVYFIQKGIEKTGENIEILNTFQQLAIIKIETAETSVVDELRVEMEINELENQLAYLKEKKQVAEIQFFNILNIDKNDALMLPNVLNSVELSESKDMLSTILLTDNHLLKQLEFNTLAWQREQVVAEKMGQPGISIGMDYAFIGERSNSLLGTENGRDAIMLPRIGMTLPLYRKKYKAMVDGALFETEASEMKHVEATRQVQNLFEKGLLDWDDANRRIALYERQFELAQKSLDLLLTSYSSDGQNFEEVLRMERKVLKYALELDKARTDENIAVAFINYLIGK